MTLIDTPLLYQLHKHREALTTLGSTWYCQVRDFTSISVWPSAVQSHKLKTTSAVDKNDDDWWDLDDFDPLAEDTFELDDQHAAFLEDDHHKEEDEVEQLVILLQTASENWLVTSDHETIPIQELR